VQGSLGVLGPRACINERAMTAVAYVAQLFSGSTSKTEKFLGRGEVRSERKEVKTKSQYQQDEDSANMEQSAEAQASPRMRESRRGNHQTFRGP